MNTIKKNVLLFCLLLCFCQKTQSNVANVVSVKPETIRILPHDSTAFTQGLLFSDGKLYESTGLTGQSTIRIVDTNGNVITKKYLPEIFAEGCAIFNDAIYQITWKEQICIVYGLNLTIKKTINYTGEGWGLTSDSRSLIMSNGSDTLFFRDADFNITRKLPVRYNGKPLSNINELEYVNGKLLANIWYNDFIYEISPQTGVVTRIIDCKELVDIEKPDSEHNVLNGIAFDSAKSLFYITGKNWKKMFLVKIPGFN